MALDLTDKTANANTLTNNGASEVTTSLPFAQSTSAADFELSESDYMSRADSASLSITGNLTIEMWIKVESDPSGSNMTLAAKYHDDGVNKRSYLFQYRDVAGTKSLLFTVSNDGTATEDYTVNWTATTGQWYHVAVTWTAASSTAKFYIDGSQQGSDQTGAMTAIHDNDSNFAIGARRTETTPIQFFDGVIDEVRVWNTVRTGTELNNNKSIELVGNESGLQAYWPWEATLGATGAGSYARSFFM